MAFPGKGQIVTIYSFVGHMVSVTTTCAVVAPAAWKICDEWRGRVPAKLEKNRQWTGGLLLAVLYFAY